MTVQELQLENIKDLQESYVKVENELRQLLAEKKSKRIELEQVAKQIDPKILRHQPRCNHFKYKVMINNDNSTRIHICDTCGNMSLR